jgi:hypothetical protein
LRSHPADGSDLKRGERGEEGLDCSQRGGEGAGGVERGGREDVGSEGGMRMAEKADVAGLKRLAIVDLREDG